jgi:hypothetical protein
VIPEELVQPYKRFTLPPLTLSFFTSHLRII